MIEVSNVSVVLRAQPILSNIDFKLDKPEFLVVLGPNGAGKTTLLKVIAGVMKPSTGYVRILGRDPAKDRSVRRLIGYVPQRERIDPTIPMLVKDIVLMGAFLSKGFPRAITYEDEEKAFKLASRLGIAELWNEPYSHLSGGQQQRAIIARALAGNTKIILLDEPFSAIDAASLNMIIDILVEEFSKGRCILMVTHDVNPVVRYATKILLLNRRLIAFGSPEDVLDESLLEKTYMRPIRVLSKEDIRLVEGADRHA